MAYFVFQQVFTGLFLHLSLLLVAKKLNVCNNLTNTINCPNYGTSKLLNLNFNKTLKTEFIEVNV